MKYILLFILLNIAYIGNAQNIFNINLYSPDSRLQIRAEIQYAELSRAKDELGPNIEPSKVIDFLTFQNVHFYIHNNTNHDLEYVINYTIIGKDKNTKEGHLGYIANDGYWGGLFIGKNGNSQDQPINNLIDNYQSKVSFEKQANVTVNYKDINQIQEIRINSIKIKDITEIESKKTRRN